MINPLKYFYHNVLPFSWKHRIVQMRTPEVNPKNAYLDMFERSQSIFIHIPKTAGTSVSEAIYGEQPWHHPVSVYADLDPEKYQQYFKFAFVRNPWDRLYSTYKYAKKISHPVYRGYLSDIARCESFEQFVLDWCEKSAIDKHWFLQPQWHYVSVTGDTLDVDFLGHFESIEKDFQALCELRGWDLQLPKKNQTSNASSWQQVYSAEMLDKVRSLYPEDINHFGYE